MAVGTLHWNIYTLSVSEGGLRGSCSPLPRAGNLILGLLMIWVRAGGAFGGVGIQQDLELNISQGWKETPLGRVLKVLLIKGAAFHSTAGSMSLSLSLLNTSRLAWLREPSLSCHSQPMM